MCRQICINGILHYAALLLQGWGENDRGVSYTFGPDSVTEFLQKHDLDLVCRAHQARGQGQRWALVGGCCEGCCTGCFVGHSELCLCSCLCNGAGGAGQLLKLVGAELHDCALFSDSLYTQLLLSLSRAG